MLAYCHCQPPHQAEEDSQEEGRGPGEKEEQKVALLPLAVVVFLVSMYSQPYTTLTNKLQCVCIIQPCWYLALALQLSAACFSNCFIAGSFQVSMLRHQY